MGAARLLRLHRPRLRAGDAELLRPGTPLGQRGAHRHLLDRLGATLRLGVDAIAVVTLAPACAACGKLLDHPTRGVVCASCWDSIPPYNPLVSDHWDGSRLISRARAIGEYEGTLRSIIHALKYDGRRTLGRPLALLMRDRTGDLLDGVACAVPVPLHPARRRHRGFNQAADLAAHLGLPVVHALERVRATATQADLPAAERHRNVQGAFKATQAARELAGAVVLLVDDVSTTGATLSACARALKDAGIEEVRALTAARVATARR